MSVLLAPSSLVELEALFTTQKRGSANGSYVSLERYWQEYYEHGERNYEWNNGKLEEKGVSQYITTQLYNWFLELLQRFLRANQIAQIVNLETGFKLNLADGQKIRKPDLGIILNTNAVPIRATDRTYQGIFDLCVEAISDSTPKERERDVLFKKEEYAQSKVKEYYVLDGTGQDMAFYHLKKYGIYEKIRPIKGDVIQSKVLPGFQFRIRDLYRRPTPKEMVTDPVYRGFMMLDYQAQKERADEERRQKEEERRQKEEERRQKEEERRQKEEEKQAKEEALQRAEEALQRAEEERARAEKERQEKERLLAKLKELGISLE